MAPTPSPRIRPATYPLLCVLAAIGTACGGGQVQPETPPAVPLTRILATLPVAARPFGIDVSSAGVVYVTQLDAGTVTTADASTSKLTGAFVVGSTPTAVAFNGTGTMAYVANQTSGTISVVNVATGAQAGVVRVSGNPFNVTVSPDGSAVYASTNDGRVSRIDPVTRTVTASVSVGTGPSSLVFHPSSGLLYVSSYVLGTINEIDPRAMRVIRTFQLGGALQGMAFAKDGSELYVADEVGRLLAVRITDGAIARSASLSGNPFGLVLTPDGAQIVLSRAIAGDVVILDRATFALVRTFALGGAPRRVALTRDGLTLVVANESGSVTFIK